MSGLLDTTANSFYMGFGPQVEGVMSWLRSPWGQWSTERYTKPRDAMIKRLNNASPLTRVAGDVLGSLLSPDVAGDIGRLGGGLLMAGVAPYLAGRKIYTPKEEFEYMMENLPKNGKPSLQEYRKIWGEKFNKDNTLSSSIQQWAPISNYDAMNFLERPVFSSEVRGDNRRPTQSVQRMWDIRSELESRHAPNHPVLMGVLDKAQNEYVDNIVPQLLRLRRTPGLRAKGLTEDETFEMGTSLIEQGIKPRMASFQDAIEFDSGRTPLIWNFNQGSQNESFLNGLLIAGETPFQFGGKTLSMGEKIGLLQAYRKDMAKDLQPYFDAAKK